MCGSPTPHRGHRLLNLAPTGAARRGFWLTVEKRDQRIVLYLTESEHQERGPA